ncbi:MAG TPA: PAS domain S-box protein, partial [Syntrophales bacterium]
MEDKPVILVVDDQPQNIKLLEQYLVPQGYEIVKAANGEEALEKLSGNQIDLIMLDVIMPGMDGFEVTRRVRQDNTHRLLPIILVTALREKEDRVKGIEAGCDDFISKPIDLMELLARVRSLLKIKAYNDLMINYRKDLESEVTSRTEELKQALEKMQQGITERKQAEEALRESEAKYRVLFEGINDAVFVHDLGEDGRPGRFLQVNDVACRRLGYTREELLSLTPLDITMPEEFERIAGKRLGLVSQGDILVETIHVTKDGRKIPVESNIRQFQYLGRQVAFSISRDITLRKQAEEALREREEKYRAIIENMEEGYHEVDIKGNFTFFNESMRKIMGYEREELLGMNNRQYADEENARKVYQAYNRIYRTGEPVKNFEWKIIRKDGYRRDIEVSISLIRDREGHPTGFRGIVRDTTDRKRAEEELMNSESKYRNIFENAMEGIYQSTLEGRFITLNAAFARMAGYDSPEDLIKSIENIGTQFYVCPEDRKRFSEIITTRGIIDGFEVEFYKKDGSTFWAVINSRAVKDEQGEILYFEGIVEDVTLRKHAEEQLRKTLENLRKAFSTTVQVLVSAVETRDPYTSGHQIRSADLARAIATEMGLPQERIDGIRMAGTIHDIGKMSVPTEILSKPTKLTELEFSLIKEHANRGFEMLKNVESPWPLAEIVYQHHERMNGSGYPRGL